MNYKKRIKELEKKFFVVYIGEPMPLWIFYQPSVIDYIIENKNCEKLKEEIEYRKKLFEKDLKEWQENRKKEIEQLNEIRKEINRLKRRKMKIQVASLTLRFYISDGWTLRKVRDLLVNPKFKIERREGDKLLGISDYFACYANSGHKIFKASKIRKHNFDNSTFNSDVNWYIAEDK